MVSKQTKFIDKSAVLSLKLLPNKYKQNKKIHKWKDRSKRKEMTPVSYTHLDVYKRQLYTRHTQYSQLYKVSSAWKLIISLLYTYFADINCVRCYDI